MTFPHVLDRRLPLAVAGSAALVALALSTAQAADENTPVNLGTTERFAVLAGAGITNTGTTSIQGDIGSFPTPTQTIPGVELDGANQADNEVTQQAKRDLVTAYDEAAGALPPTSVETELGGKTLVGGVYKAATELGLTGTLTLDGGRDDGMPSDKVFIFQAGTTLITEVDSEVVLTGGAQACNVFWQVGSAATFKTRTAFVGTVMAYTEAITAQTGATFVGRLLARDSAVTLDTNTITRPTCITGDDEDDGGGGADGGDDTGGADDGGDTGGDDTGGTDGGDTGGTDGGDTGGTDGGDTGGTDDGAAVGDTREGGADGTSGGVDATDSSSRTGASDESPSSSDTLPDAGGSTLWLLAAGLGTLMAGSALLWARRGRGWHSS